MPLRVRVHDKPGRVKQSLPKNDGAQETTWEEKMPQISRGKLHSKPNVRALDGPWPWPCLFIILRRKGQFDLPNGEIRGIFLRFCQSAGVRTLKWVFPGRETWSSIVFRKTP